MQCLGFTSNLLKLTYFLQNLALFQRVAPAQSVSKQMNQMGRRYIKRRNTLCRGAPARRRIKLIVNTIDFRTEAKKKLFLTFVSIYQTHQDFKKNKQVAGYVTALLLSFAQLLFQVVVPLAYQFLDFSSKPPPPSPFFIWINRILQKHHVNEMEQEDEFINAFDFLNNFQC